MNQTILIAGGSGLIGKALIKELIKHGYRIKLLSRHPGKSTDILSYHWDPARNEMDLESLKDVDYIINLAGANVGEGKWTPQRKQELTDSRVQSTLLLTKTLISHQIPIRKFIQASAIGYYGFSTSYKIFSETDKNGKDFLAKLTGQWERETDRLERNGIPRLILRIGVVLSADGGALKALAKPIKQRLGAPLGSGKQIVPWIHVYDLIQAILFSITSEKMQGIYNVVAPSPVSNETLTKVIASAMKKPVWSFHVPEFILRMMLGEQADIILNGNHVSSQKLRDAGFVFQYPEIKMAVNSLLNSKFEAEQAIKA